MGQGFKLFFAEDAITKIVHRVVLRNVGARGLRTIVENLTGELIFAVMATTEEEYIVNREAVIDGQPFRVP